MSESVGEILSSTTEHSLLSDALKAERQSHQDTLTRITKLNNIISEQEDNIGHLNQQLVEKSAKYETELLSLKKQLYETQTSLPNSPRNRKESGPRITQDDIDHLSKEVAKLSEENRSLSIRANTATETFVELENTSRLCNAQQDEISRLRARVDAYDFLKTDYTRITEENERKDRLIERLSKDLASARDEKRPRTSEASEAELINFKISTEREFKKILQTIQETFGWNIRLVGSDEWHFHRHATVVRVKNGQLVSACLPEGFPATPSLTLPQLLALLVLE